MTNRPSLGRGGRMAAGVFALVAVLVWLVGILVALPMVLGLEATVVEAISGLGNAPRAAEDALVLGADAMEDGIDGALVAALAVVASAWAWGVLWRAGVARWWVWRPQPRIRLAEMLGLGLTGWWRYARLSAVAGCGTAAAGALVLVGLVAAASAVDGGSTAAATAWALAGIASGVVLGAAVWAARLRACWELARPDRTSAVMAFLRGAAQTVRQPFASAAPVVVWGGTIVLASVAPLVLGWWAPAVRAPVALGALLLAAGAVRAFARVALLASYGPEAVVSEPAPPGAASVRRRSPPPGSPERTA